MFKSIKIRVFAYFFSLVMIVLLIIWVGLNFYIEGYYYGQKIEDMQKTIRYVEDMYKSNVSGLEMLAGLEEIGYHLGGKISVYSDDSIITVSEKNVYYKKGDIIKKIVHNDAVAYVYESNTTSKVGSWLVYGEKLYNEKIVMLEIPVESIDNTLNIVEQFFSYLVLISIVVATIFALILSKNIADPVTELNEIAKEIGNLNFDKSYLGNREDEIGQLGKTLNSIMGYLERTIKDLQHELNKEKQLDSMRKSFIAQVSHELQTPLTVINGYVEALEDNMVETEDEKQYYYEIIADEAAKMSRLVRELLDLTQLESGTFKMKKEWTDFSLLLDKVCDKYQKLAEAKNIIWLYNKLNEELLLYIDPIRIEQAITNIINNAFKHTKSNNKILINTSIQESKVIIKIENEGENIPEDQIDFIWQSFYKAKSSTNKQGTGLGLAIAANVFKYHNIEYKAYNLDYGVGFKIIINRSENNYNNNDCLGGKNEG